MITGNQQLTSCNPKEPDMNGLEAEQIVTSSLTRRGASCKYDTKQPDTANIIATWKSTVWRILVKTMINKDEEHSWPKNEEIKKLQNNAAEHNQKAVIAWVYPDSNIEYRAAGDGRIVRPRCLIKVRRTKILKKEYHEQN